MDRQYPETLGVRRTGWAALDRDPQQDTVEFVCPHCGASELFIVLPMAFYKTCRAK